ncbi:MAG: hypothetical protein WBG01_10725, partial [Bacteroidota bacterium]
PHGSPSAHSTAEVIEQRHDSPAQATSGQRSTDKRMSRYTLDPAYLIALTLSVSLHHVPLQFTV